MSDDAVYVYGVVRRSRLPGRLARRGVRLVSSGRLAALVSGAPFLHNLLEPGQTGTLLSSGSVAFVNWSVALEVAAAILLLFSEFLKHYVVPVGGGNG